VTLECGKASKDRNHELAMRSAGITPGISQAFETSSTLGNGIEDIEQVPC
jgi:hypothetical protein